MQIKTSNILVLFGLFCFHTFFCFSDAHGMSGLKPLIKGVEGVYKGKDEAGKHCIVIDKNEGWFVTNVGKLTFASALMLVSSVFGNVTLKKFLSSGGSFLKDICNVFLHMGSSAFYVLGSASLLVFCAGGYGWYYKTQEKNKYAHLLTLTQEGIRYKGGSLVPWKQIKKIGSLGAKLLLIVEKDEIQSSDPIKKLKHNMKQKDMVIDFHDFPKGFKRKHFRELVQDYWNKYRKK